MKFLAFWTSALDVGLNGTRTPADQLGYWS